MIYCKGAPEVVINLSTHIVGDNGEINVLSSTQRDELTSMTGIVA